MHTHSNTRTQIQIHSACRLQGTRRTVANKRRQQQIKDAQSRNKMHTAETRCTQQTDDVHSRYKVQTANRRRRDQIENIFQKGCTHAVAVEPQSVVTLESLPSVFVNRLELPPALPKKSRVMVVKERKNHASPFCACILAL